MTREFVSGRWGKNTPAPTNQFASRPFAPPPESVPEVQTSPEDPQTDNQNPQGTLQQSQGDRLKRISITPPNPFTPRVQPKLTIGEPGDKYETEADTIARKVVGEINSPPKVQTQKTPQRQIKPIVQRFGGESATPDLEATIQRARNCGKPLSAGIREPMEQAFGADFSGVKVHTDSQSDRLNRSIQAKAFTTGQDIFFREGTYDPSTPTGQELIAHELTHVVQQSGVSRLQLQTESLHPKGCTCLGCKPTVRRKQDLQINNSQHSIEDIIQRVIFKEKTPRQKFDKKKFKRKNWQPSTGQGKFDAEYSPKTGILSITLKVHFNFQDSSAYANVATNPVDTRWTAQGKKQWFNEFVAAVNSKWGNISPITCDKPGFKDVVVQPKIKIVQAKAGNAHWNLDVTKAFIQQDKGKMRAGGFSGVTRDGGGAFQEFDTKDKINDSSVKDHLAQTEKTTNIEPAYRRDRERLVACLEAIGFIKFKSNSADLLRRMDTKLNQAAQSLAALQKNSALAHLHPLKIKVVTRNNRLMKARKNVIKSFLARNGVNQPITAEKVDAEKVDINTPRNSAKIEVDTNISDDSMLDRYENHWSRITAAHEFGHMIGLLDEYCPAVSPELLQKMVNEGAIPLKDQTNLSTYATSKQSQNENEQTAYAKLLDKTGLETPTWARPTATQEEKSTSLMSGGFEILKQHYVTIWEVLADMTKDFVEDTHWKI